MQAHIQPFSISFSLWILSWELNLQRWENKKKMKRNDCISSNPLQWQAALWPASEPGIHWNLLWIAVIFLLSTVLFFFMVNFTCIFVSACTAGIHRDLSQNSVKLRSYNYCFSSQTISHSNTDFYLIFTKLPLSSSNHGSEYPYNPYAALGTQSCMNSASDFECC